MKMKWRLFKVFKNIFKSSSTPLWLLRNVQMLILKRLYRDDSSGIFSPENFFGNLKQLFSFSV